MPKKPTQPFSNIVFRANGTVARNVYRLPDDKEEQERTAFRWFVDLFNGTDQGCRIENVEPLPQDDHDFLVSVDGQVVEVQLTELAPREYRQGPPPALPGPSTVDHAAADVALRNVIERKVSKRYARGARSLWLVVFATEPYTLRYGVNGAMHVTRALPEAWQYLDTVENLVFDQIWFTDLQSRPVRVWPTDDRSLPCVDHPIH